MLYGNLFQILLRWFHVLLCVPIFSISIFLFSLVYIALGAIPGSPQLRILTALYDLLISREFNYSVCNFVDALVAIYQLRVLVRYVCTRYVCTPSLPPLPPSR